MIGKERLLESIAYEFEICKKLHGRLSEDRLNYKFSDVLRSNMELLQYLSFSTFWFASYLVDIAYDTNHTVDWDELAEEAKNMSYEAFPGKMDSQLVNIRELLNKLTEDDLVNKKVTGFWLKNSALGAGIMDVALKNIVAYRMQLFLTIKASGLKELKTKHCWTTSD